MTNVIDLQAARAIRAARASVPVDGTIPPVDAFADLVRPASDWSEGYAEMKLWASYADLAYWRAVFVREQFAPDSPEVEAVKELRGEVQNNYDAARARLLLIAAPTVKALRWKEDQLRSSSLRHPVITAAIERDREALARPLAAARKRAVSRRSGATS